MIDLMWQAVLRGGGAGGIIPRKAVENPRKIPRLRQ
jgi:hypothetical protein